MSRGSVLQLLDSRRGYVGSTGRQTHYREHGSGAPVLLLHGTGFDSSFWMRALPLLGVGRRAIAPDLAGYGLSDRPTAPEPLSYYGDRVLELMDELVIDRADIVGFHTGASIAVDIAARHPDRVGSVVLAGLLALDPQCERDRWYDSLVIGESGPLATAALLQEQTERWKTFSATDDPERYRAMLIARLIAAPPELSTYLPLRDYDILAGVDSVTAPTLVIQFDRDVVPADRARAAAARLRNGRFVEIPGESHELLSNPVPVCELIGIHLAGTD